MLLFTSFSGFAFEPPVIQDPTPLVVCDSLNNGFEAFDLTVKIPEVLGALNPTLFTVTFHETMVDGETGSNAILNPTSYYNNINQTQTIYIRVAENASGDFSVTTLVLILNSMPTPLQPLNLSIEQIPFTGTAIFDLTSNDGLLVNGVPDVFVTYYPTIFDAEINANVILNPATYPGSNGQQIGVRVTNTTTLCSVVKSFYLYITNPDIVYIPDPIFKNYLVNHNPTIDSNGNSEIEYTEAEAYSNLFLIGEMNISDLTGVEAFINLTQLHCYNNNLTSLDLGGLTNLNALYCYGNQLTSLNLDGDYNLTIIDCYENQLTSLDVSGLSNLYELFCNDNQLTSLQLAGTTSLGDLKCENNQLTNLDVSNSANLISLGCSGNPITSLGVSNLTSLQYLYCYDTLISTLDVTNNTSLITLVYNDNPNLISVYMKNGANEDINLSNNPNLRFICADESQIQSIQSQLYVLNMIYTVCNSYCSYTPGGNYNTITGTLTFDDDDNGCDVTDIRPSYVRVNMTDGLNSGSSFTGFIGNYAFYTQALSNTVVPVLENPTWFTFSPTTALVSFPNNNNNISENNFCITANGIHPDLEVVIAPIMPARPGFDAVYQIVYKNKGNQTLSGNILFAYDDTVLDFVSATLTPNTQTTGSLAWNFTNLTPFENRSFYITVNVNAPTDTPAVNIGDELSFTATVNPIAGDETQSDNAFQYDQTVVGSFDPNNIICMEGNVVSPSEIGNYLHYVINFENTGTADAENIIVKEVIDTEHFDISSLQLMSSSAPIIARITGNVAEFIFQNINLHSGGHGNILLKIRSNAALVAGDMVSKKANIFFDYNFPVETQPEDTVFQSLSNPDVAIDASVSVYPNPAKGLINIECNNTIKSVQLYDVQGRILQTNLGSENQVSLDISTQSNGIYFIKIISDNGMKVQKVVKE